MGRVVFCVGSVWMLGLGRVSPEIVRFGLRSIGSRRGRPKLVGFYLDGVGVRLGGFTGAVSADVWSNMVRVVRVWSGQGRGWSRVDGFG